MRLTRPLTHRICLFSAARPGIGAGLLLAEASGNIQCTLGPLRKRLRSLDLMRMSMVEPSR